MVQQGQGNGFGFVPFYRQMASALKKNYCLWPVAAMAVIGPCFSLYVGLHKLQGPDVTLSIGGHNPDAHDKFEHKKYRLYELTPFDYANYQHPRPRF